MTEDSPRWLESWSTTYQALAAVAVPSRAEQIATLLSLIPFDRSETFLAVEAGCGEGFLSCALLEAFPNARVLALDGSSLMRETTMKRLSKYSGRAEVAGFDLFDESWVQQVEGAGAVLSSLAIHHLDDSGKQQLYGQIANRLSSRGALLVADLVDAGHPVVNQYFGDVYERTATAQSLEMTGSNTLYDLFNDEEWNHFRYPDLEVDKPSRLVDQLDWLREAGFKVADCFWLNAGHAIYGGFMSAACDLNEPLRFQQGFDIAQQVLKDGYREQQGD